MRSTIVVLFSFLPPIALAGEVEIDRFEGPLAWKAAAGGGRPVELRNAERGLRLTYKAEPPFWSNVKRPIAVGPDAVAVGMSILVHSAEPEAAMHFWLFEPDRDGWLARVLRGGRSLADLGPGWHEIVVPVADFQFQARGPGSRQMESAQEMFIGCNYADLDVTIGRLWFITAEEADTVKLPRSAGLVPESGALGRVAILGDDDLSSGAGAASPGKIASILREIDYGVTLLGSGDVADPAVLDPKQFDVLIVPCAPAYPSEGRDALLRFLKGGGSLVSLGGYAFDRPVVKTAAGWRTPESTVRVREMNRPRTGPVTINTRIGVPGDTMRLAPDQIGVFDPSYLLRHVAYAETAPGQTFLREPLRISGPLEGYAASAMIGSNSPVFPDIYARWIPLVNGYDRFGRFQGAVAGLVHHWRGPFAGSSWALLGVTNHDLIGSDPAGPALLRAMVRAVTRPVFLHGLATDMACYRDGEPVRATVDITNHGPAERKFSVHFRMGDGEPIVVETVVAAGETESVAATIHEGPFGTDYSRVTAELVDLSEETVLDSVATAFVVWNEELVGRGPKIELRDNYFTLDGVPRFICGSNQTGMMWYEENENPATWERDFAKMEASGMRMLRILHFSPFAADDPLKFRGRGVNVLEGRPKRLLRQTDAIVQLAQKHGVVVFLTLHDWMPIELSDDELDVQRRWARFWADRYRNVPGIIYDVQNEPGARNRVGAQAGDWHDLGVFEESIERVDTLNRWIGANVRGVKEGDPDALVTVGFLQMIEPADHLLGTMHTDFNNMHYHSSVAGFPAGFKLTDRRSVGKSFSLGEFGARESHDARTHGADGTKADESIRRFLTLTHEAFGMGASFALNWDWKDFDGCVFPWGLNHACGLVDKPLLPAYRNMSLFLGRFRPRYLDPGVYLLVPDSHRLGAWSTKVHAAIRRTCMGLLSLHVDFNVTNEFDLDKLPDTCRTLIWPVPYCPRDETFRRVLEFVRSGGSLYLSGDVAYDIDRQRTRAGRLAELGLEDEHPVPPWDKAPGQSAGKIQRGKVGKGKVFYAAWPLELEDGPTVPTLREFLAFAGEKRIPVQPDDPGLFVFTVGLADGTVTVVSNRTGSDQLVRLAGGDLSIAKDLTGLLATNGSGEVTAVECTGQWNCGGRRMTTGGAHVMMTALDGRPLGESHRVAIFPVMAGSLTVWTDASWQQPVLEVGQFDGPTWKSLSTTPVEVVASQVKIDIDDDLVRSILVLREKDAPGGL